ncbi:MAG: glycosyltransferase, partial [Micrococcaceae bacterium]|nr:glycosyltransferase [Micrococcaceae bacterium]
MSGDKPLTILIAADTYPPDINGAAVFSHRLATAMQARGHTVHVVAARDVNGPGVVEHRREATVHRLRSHSQPTQSTLRLCLPWEAKRDIGAILDEIKPDIVHV